MRLDATEWVRPIYALAFVIFQDREVAARWEASSKDPSAGRASLTRLTLVTSLATIGDRKGVTRAIRKGAKKKETAPSPVERATEHLLEALSSGSLRAVRGISGPGEPIPQECWTTWASVKRRGGEPYAASGLGEDDACFVLGDGGWFPVRLSLTDLMQLPPLNCGRARQAVQREVAAGRRQESRQELAEWRFGQIATAARAIMSRPRPKGFGRWRLADNVARIVKDKARIAGMDAEALERQETHLVLKNTHKGMCEYIGSTHREALAKEVDAFLLRTCTT